ncbi:hypothetical protein AN958_03568, partial [Leucoagaricus sp. SymC.cos]
NKQSAVKHYINMEMTIDDKTVKQPLYVTNLNNQQMILRTPFLESTNPDIDWRKQTFKWREEKLLPKLLHSTNQPIDLNLIQLNHITETINEEDEIYEYEDELEDYAETYSYDKYLLEDKMELIINKINFATKIAQQQKPKKAPMLPDRFKKYAKVFNKDKSERYPPKQVYDHKIETKLTFVPKSFKLYKLSPIEQEELKKFIDKNLQKGYIIECESEIASPFFFVDKKDRKL